MHNKCVDCIGSRYGLANDASSFAKTTVINRSQVKIIIVANTAKGLSTNDMIAHTGAVLSRDWRDLCGRPTIAPQLEFDLPPEAVGQPERRQTLLSIATGMSKLFAKCHLTR